MALKRTPAGYTHGEAPALPVHLVITLEPGWRLLEDGVSFGGGRHPRLEPPLMPGARLVPAMPLASSGNKAPSAAEKRLLRFVHLRLPAGADADGALEEVRRWPCVERAERAPQVSLP